MKKLSLAVAVSLLSIAGAAFSQGASSGIMESTDPAKAAAVEEHARELQARQDNMPQKSTSGMTSAKPKKEHRMHKGAAKSDRSGDAASGASGNTGGADNTGGK
jgi:hypothetical protein